MKIAEPKPIPPSATPDKKTHAGDLEYSEYNESQITSVSKEKVEVKEDPMDDFKKAEMRIKQLLEMKNAEPSYGNFKVKDSKGNFVKPEVKIEQKKIIPMPPKVEQKYDPGLENLPSTDTGMSKVLYYPT